MYKPWREHPWKKGYPIRKPYIQRLPKITFDKQPCKHDSCPQCNGTGIKEDGQRCLHMISCPCPKCNPYTLKV